MMPTQPSNEAANRPVRHAGREYPVIGRRRICGRTFLLVKQLAASPRVSFQAFDTRVREFRRLLAIPASSVSRRQLHAVQRAASANDSIPKLVDFASVENDYWLVLTWVSGSDLKGYLRAIRAGRVARPSSREVIRLIRGLAHGLRHLHNNGNLIHGDLKPANLILQSRPTRLVTIDFGNAWLRERSSMVGTGDGYSSTYAAPELQTADEQPDFRSDQFSASAIAYELLTLNIPYDSLGGKAGRPGFSDSPISLERVSKHSPDASRLPRITRHAIDDVIARGLSLSVEHRFDTPRAWVDALDLLWHDINDRSRRDNRDDLLWRFCDWTMRMLSGS